MCRIPDQITEITEKRDLLKNQVEKLSVDLKNAELSHNNESRRHEKLNESLKLKIDQLNQIKYENENICRKVVSNDLEIKRLEQRKKEQLYQLNAQNVRLDRLRDDLVEKEQEKYVVDPVVFGRNVDWIILGAPQKRHIVFDSPNICRHDGKMQRNESVPPMDYRKLKAAIEFFTSRHHQVILVIKEFHRRDKELQGTPLHSLCTAYQQNLAIKYVSSGIDDDIVVIQEAVESFGIIVSNDKYRQYLANSKLKTLQEYVNNNRYKFTFKGESEPVFMLKENNSTTSYNEEAFTFYSKDYISYCEAFKQMGWNVNYPPNFEEVPDTIANPPTIVQNICNNFTFNTVKNSVTTLIPTHQNYIQYGNARQPRLENYNSQSNDYLNRSQASSYTAEREIEIVELPPTPPQQSPRARLLDDDWDAWGQPQ